MTIATNVRAYDPSVDFLRIRQFLIETFALFGGPANWTVDRWNFCRYFVVPVHSYYSVQTFGVPTQPRHCERDELALWEKAIGIWENERGCIVGVVCTENEEPGEAWLQIHPDYASFCTIWLDERNRYANFEPVGTRAEYRGMGLGRALLLEGFRRMARYGAQRSFMASDNPFYRKLGFEAAPYSFGEWIKYFSLDASPEAD